MKAKNNNNLTKSILVGILATMMIFPFTSCSKKINFATSKFVPAAEGSVKVTQDKNKNYEVQVQITNLADVTKMTPPKKTYVVWMISDLNKTINIGVVNSSSKLNVSFETVSSFKPTKIFLTAEDEASVQYPDDKIILTTESFVTK